MAERKLDAANAQARAIRDFPEKVRLYAEALHFSQAHVENWAWNPDGSNVTPSAPSMMQIETWFKEKIMCEVCQGLKYILKPLSDFSQHGATRCHSCRGTGRRHEDED